MGHRNKRWSKKKEKKIQIIGIMGKNMELGGQRSEFRQREQNYQQLFLFQVDQNC